MICPLCYDSGWLIEARDKGRVTLELIHCPNHDEIWKAGRSTQINEAVKAERARIRSVLLLLLPDTEAHAIIDDTLDLFRSIKGRVTAKEG